ncbi:LysR family transcriptional regulator [Luteibacter aegosomatis]|uniref:LysR family transcriptional regulator n=1 Tax=Luteibacter aegosomatis TaxID=2911537 RepID=UPI001FFA82C2|nr:LysR family transcriptional regulator [Luteibacter aegosomatis]UPG87485.1 LysR family transcriptional regulator [Luteibacter aegosomatis]
MNNPGDALASTFSASYAGVVAFIAVVAEGSFARAADRLGIGRSAVSRSVQKLEGQVGARLFARTTRSTTLTREGELFYENCRPGVDRIAQALEDMRELRDGPPRGQLRVSAPVGFGRHVVAPLLYGFRALYPEIAVDLLLDDRPADFTGDRVDVAFRDGRMEDSDVVARRIVPMRLFLCASPDYLRRHGAPASVDDLPLGDCLSLRLPNGRAMEWEFREDGKARRLTPGSMLSFNDADLVSRAALGGQGFAQLPGYQVREYLDDGRLVACLPQYAPDDRGHYLCYLSRRQMPSRIRVFIDHMIASIRALDLDGGHETEIGALAATA